MDTVEDTEFETREERLDWALEMFSSPVPLNWDYAIDAAQVLQPTWDSSAVISTLDDILGAQNQLDHVESESLNTERAAERLYVLRASLIGAQS